MSDRIFGGVGLLLAVLYCWQATVIQESPFSDVIGPKVFPMIIAGVLGLSSIYFIAVPDRAQSWPPLAQFFELAMAVAVMFAYSFALPHFGFLIATALASAYLGWRLGSTPAQSILAGVLTSGGIYVVFHLILGLSLAKGPFGF